MTKIRSCLRRRCLQARVELSRRRSGCFSAAAKRKQASSAMFQCAILHGRVAKASFLKKKEKKENGGARERERKREKQLNFSCRPCVRPLCLVARSARCSSCHSQIRGVSSTEHIQSVISTSSKLPSEVATANRLPPPDPSKSILFLHTN